MESIDDFIMIERGAYYIKSHYSFSELLAFVRGTKQTHGSNCIFEFASRNIIDKFSYDCFDLL